MFGFLFGTHSGQKRKKIDQIVDQIISFQEEMKGKTDIELGELTEVYKKRYEQGETLDELLPEVFATAREATARALGEEQDSLALAISVALHQGQLVECDLERENELSIICAIYLHAITGEGVFVALDDEKETIDVEVHITGVCDMLSVSYGCNIGYYADRKAEVFQKDIIISSINEFVFDYLRDSIADSEEKRLIRNLSYLLIYKGGHGLISAGREPFNLTRPTSKSTRLYECCAMVCGQLTRGEDLKQYIRKEDCFHFSSRDESGDFMIIPKEEQVVLTREGIATVEKFFFLDNLMDPENREILHAVKDGLIARHIYVRDIDYCVREGKIMVIDKKTKQVAPNARFRNGLQQSIEAKENVRITKERALEAKTTLWEVIGKFGTCSGLLGGTLQGKKEFVKESGMGVIEIRSK